MSQIPYRPSFLTQAGEEAEEGEEDQEDDDDGEVDCRRITLHQGILNVLP